MYLCSNPEKPGNTSSVMLHVYGYQPIILTVCLLVLYRGFKSRSLSRAVRNHFLLVFSMLLMVQADILNPNFSDLLSNSPAQAKRDHLQVTLGLSNQFQTRSPLYSNKGACVDSFIKKLDTDEALICGDFNFQYYEGTEGSITGWLVPDKFFFDSLSKNKRGMADYVLAPLCSSKAVGNDDVITPLIEKVHNGDAYVVSRNAMLFIVLHMDLAVHFRFNDIGSKRSYQLTCFGDECQTMASIVDMIVNELWTQEFHDALSKIVVGYDTYDCRCPNDDDTNDCSVRFDSKIKKIGYKCKQPIHDLPQKDRQEIIKGQSL